MGVITVSYFTLPPWICKGTTTPCLANVTTLRPSDGPSARNGTLNVSIHCFRSSYFVSFILLAA